MAENIVKIKERSTGKVYNKKILEPKLEITDGNYYSATIRGRLGQPGGLLIIAKTHYETNYRTYKEVGDILDISFELEDRKTGEQREVGIEEILGKPGNIKGVRYSGPSNEFIVIETSYRRTKESVKDTLKLSITCGSYNIDTGVIDDTDIPRLAIKGDLDLTKYSQILKIRLSAKGGADLSSIRKIRLSESQYKKSPKFVNNLIRKGKVRVVEIEGKGIKLPYLYANPGEQTIRLSGVNTVHSVVLSGSVNLKNHILYESEKRCRRIGTLQVEDESTESRKKSYVYLQMVLLSESDYEEVKEIEDFEVIRRIETETEVIYAVLEKHYIE